IQLSACGLFRIGSDKAQGSIDLFNQFPNLTASRTNSFAATVTSDVMWCDSRALAACCRTKVCVRFAEAAGARPEARPTNPAKIERSWYDGRMEPIEPETHALTTVDNARRSYVSRPDCDFSCGAADPAGACDYARVVGLGHRRLRPCVRHL